jgi:hypothetical protein
MLQVGIDSIYRERENCKMEHQKAPQKLLFSILESMFAQKDLLSACPQIASLQDQLQK